MEQSLKEPMSRLRTTAMTLLMLALLASAACSSSDTGTGKAAEAPAEISLDEDSRWQDVFDTFTTSEQNCVRAAIDSEQLESLLDRLVLSEDDEPAELGTVFECLDAQTANNVLAEILIAAMLSSGDADEFGPDDVACVRGVVEELDAVALMSSIFEPSPSLEDFNPSPSLEDSDIEALVFGVSDCLGDGLGLGDSPVEGPPPGPEHILWEYPTGGAGLPTGREISVSPTVANGMVYARSDENRVYALNAETGELVWSFETADGYGDPPEISEGVVHFSDVDGVHWLDALTGELLWSNAEIHEAVASQGTVYAFAVDWDSDDGAVLALDERSGRQRWRTDTRDFRLMPSFPLLFPLTAAGANVYLSDHHTVHALDAATGERIWSFEADAPVVTPPAASEGTVYLQSYDTAYALDEATGETRWSHSESLSGFLADGPPTVVDGVWYLAVDTGIRAVDATTGESLWHAEMDFPTHDTVRVADGTVFVESYVTGDLNAIDATTGETTSVSAGFGGSMQTSGGVVYSHTAYGKLHAADAATGEPVWSLDTGYHQGWRRPFAVADGAVYVGVHGDEARVLALRGRTNR